MRVYWRRPLGIDVAVGGTFSVCPGELRSLAMRTKGSGTIDCSVRRVDHRYKGSDRPRYHERFLGLALVYGGSVFR